MEANPSDTVILRQAGNHSIQFSKSRGALLIITEDYHAEPLVLTKWDLLELLMAMESNSPGGDADKATHETPKAGRSRRRK
jgi:hypothetical protein